MELGPLTLISLSGATALVAVAALFAVMSRKGRTEDQARAYLAGFTYVLSDDPDAAIAELSKAAQLDNRTLETYFALGALFRRKGELDRAVRLHTNILLRPGLTPDVKRRAQLALAFDYKRSGLKDKAAQTYQKLLLDEPDNKEALQRFRQVLEEGKDWAGAVELQTRLLKKEGSGQEVLAHLLAEAAREEFSHGKFADAEALAQRAVELFPRSANAQLSLLQVRASTGGEALAPAMQALALEPELAPRHLPLFIQALGHQALGAELDRLSAKADGHPAYELARSLQLSAQGRADAAIARLKALVERRPGFWEARKELGALLLANDRSDELRADYQQILGTLGQPAPGFHCVGCRQKLPEHLFRCPACEEWDSVRRER